MVTTNKQIDRFIESWIKTTGDMDFSTLTPFSHLQFHPLFADEYLKKLWQLIENEKTISLAKKLKGKVSPGIISDQMFFTAVDLKFAKSPLEKRMKVMEFFSEVLSTLHAGDAYVSNGKNLVENEFEVNKNLEKINFNAASEEIARHLGELYTVLYHLSNGLYGDIYMGICIQNYGPYNVVPKFGNGHELVVKNAFNLQPVEIWPTAKELPGETVKIHCVYKDAKFKTDAFSCHSNYEGDPIKGLKHWAVEVDGKPFDLPEVKELTEILTLESDKRWKNMMDLPFEELKQKGLFIRQYAFKPLFDAVELDWKPSQKMIDAVKNKPFAVAKQRDKEFWRKILDPREDFNFSA